MIEDEHERSFPLFGSQVRLLVGPPLDPALAAPEFAAIAVEASLRTVHERLTRFDPDSELSALNADPEPERAVSPVLALAVRASRDAAEATGGLVDPTLVGEIERAGYASSRVGTASEALGDALAAAPRRRPASPRPDSRWREIFVDATAGLVRRPPGVRIDTGGMGKGLAADLAYRRLAGYARCVVDVGGDLRVGGARAMPRSVSIEHPLREDPALVFEMTAGAVATSGVATRIWRSGSGFSHHLLDPSTGEPAWTGVIQATALAPKAVEAETLSKAALLSGPARGKELLARRGGALILDHGAVVVAGSLGGPAS